MGLHRDVFTGRHRDGSGNEPRQPRDAHQALGRIGPGNPQDERDIRDETIGRSKNSCTSRPAMQVAMVVVAVQGWLGFVVGHPCTLADRKPSLTWGLARIRPDGKRTSRECGRNWRPTC